MGITVWAKVGLELREDSACAHWDTLMYSLTSQGRSSTNTEAVGMWPPRYCVSAHPQR